MRTGIPVFIITLVVSVATVGSDIYSPPAYVKADMFDIDLVSATGSTLTASITWPKSVESIPFWVEYAVDGLDKDCECLWILFLPLVLDASGVQQVHGVAVRFASLSNAKHHELTLLVTFGGTIYE